MNRSCLKNDADQRLSARRSRLVRSRRGICPARRGRRVPQSGSGQKTFQIMLTHRLSCLRISNNYSVKRKKKNLDSHENVSRNVKKTLLMSMENCETVTSQIDLLKGKQVQPLFPYHDIEKKCKI